MSATIRKRTDVDVIYKHRHVMDAERESWNVKNWQASAYLNNHLITSINLRTR